MDRLVASEFSSNNNKQLTSGWIHRIVRVYLENEELAVDPDMIMEKLKSYAPVIIVDNKTRALLKTIEYRTVMVNGHEQSMNLSLESVLMKPVASPEPKVANDNTLSCTSQESKHGAVTPQPFDKKRNAAMTWDDEQQTPISVLDMNKPIGSMNALDWRRAQDALAHETCCQSAFTWINRLIREDSQRVTTEWLNRLVEQWMKQGTMPPSELLVKLSDYAPLTDKSTYDIIVSGIQQKTTSIWNPQVGSMSNDDWERALAELTTLTNLELPVTPTRLSSAWNILDRLMEEEKYGKEHSNNYKSQLHPGWLNRIVEAWCKCPSAEEASEILVRINRYAPELTPDLYIYQMIIDTVSKEKELQTTRQQLRSQAKISRERETTKGPRDDKRKRVTSAPAVRRERSHSDHVLTRSAPTVSQERSHSVHNNGSDHAPTTRLYNRRLQNWFMNSTTNCDPDKAEGLLNEMWELYNAGNLSVKPDTSSYNIVLTVIARSERRDSGERAETLLRRMQELHDAGDETVKPDLTSFTTCIAACASTGDNAAAERAESLFRLLHEMYEAGDASLKPDSFAYKSLLKTLSRAANYRFGDISESILLKMHELHENGDVDVKPDTTSYNLVMKAISKSYGVNKAKRAERVESMLNTMEQQYASGNVSLKPNLQSYQSVIMAWSKCPRVPHSGDRTEYLLKRSETILRVKPGRKIYNAVILAHARSGAAEKAEKVLERLEREGSHTSPDAMSYDMVIAAYARKGAPLRAEAMLNRMQKLYDAGNSSVKPNPFTYSKIALAWLNSKSDNAINNAIKYLEILKTFRGAVAKQEFESTYKNIMNVLYINNEESPELDKLRERIEWVRTDEACSVSLSREGGEKVLNEKPKARPEERDTPQGEAVHTSTTSTNDTTLTTSFS